MRAGFAPPKPQGRLGFLPGLEFLRAVPAWCLGEGIVPFDRIPVSGIPSAWMIRSFGDERTAALFRDERVRQFAGIARAAKRKLEAVNAAGRREDLTIPPSNRLERLKGNLKEFYSIRINDQWRMIFKWINGEPHQVRIVDYH
jgi:toxin HigB-1